MDVWSRWAKEAEEGIDMSMYKKTGKHIHLLLLLFVSSHERAELSWAEQTDANIILVLRVTLSITTDNWRL